VTVSRRLRAPQQNGGVVAEPALVEVGQLLAANRQKLSIPAPELWNRPWFDLRRQARKLAVQAARDYLRWSGEPIPNYGDASVLMAGHQPELFHPGVWVKNFALQGLAARHEATPLHLVVDNDTAKSTSLHVPEVTMLDGPMAHVANVPFDHWSGEVPYEERAVQDEPLFASLPERAAPLLKDKGFAPLLTAYWDEVRKQTARTQLLGERLAAARRTFERSWGCHNLELPVSALCRTEPFAWFACHILAHLPRFHSVYNQCVSAYRRQYGIRSRNHPVPDLANEGEWLEVPLWTWRSGQSQRRRLMARPMKENFALRMGEETGPELPWGPDGDPSRTVRAWQDLERQGIKIRSRALTNTLFARLFLADLFIHGIGGGKYDELTDEIVRRFYGFEPPGFLVLSATLRLPLPSLPGGPEVCRRLARELRDLRYNPQRHLPGNALAEPRVRQLASQKQSWIARQPIDGQQRRERFQRLREITDQLRLSLADQEAALQQELVDCERDIEVNGVLQQRDYPFCLYPEALLRPFCTQFLLR
jgi:hypothetical protein